MTCMSKVKYCAITCRLLVLNDDDAVLQHAGSLVAALCVTWPLIDRANFDQFGIPAFGPLSQSTRPCCLCFQAVDNNVVERHVALCPKFACLLRHECCYLSCEDLCLCMNFPLDL
eukprot:TRINITY_DN2386_c0_g3_i1.p2 TRINITY_DN2386_c0_g3~~TRINITY_DN2386_c0_g3_i1.p2  ORF type:complete len:115 (+),score=0.34 TRINITY_DN2386_c0_g3_i1:141-485(+)